MSEHEFLTSISSLEKARASLINMLDGSSKSYVLYHGATRHIDKAIGLVRALYADYQEGGPND